MHDLRCREPLFGAAASGYIHVHAVHACVFCAPCTLVLEWSKMCVPYCVRTSYSYLASFSFSIFYWYKLLYQVVVNIRMPQSF
ncbi:hypothetical protein C8J57DRAFT_1327500 [Mycena rebaudengoi]|nr:hypothetical protein C8J57DRAFT_1406705 [Mycena rebaudengoi]KAJ7267363.1 hypothetical protein C8J57DRAFT_1327500 [Mycena rebaudengoi]